jgi:hypothetical protein
LTPVSGVTSHPHGRTVMGAEVVVVARRPARLVGQRVFPLGKCAPLGKGRLRGTTHPFVGACTCREGARLTKPSPPSDHGEKVMPQESDGLSEETKAPESQRLSIC